MTVSCDPVQGQGHGSSKVIKWPISKFISSASMHVIKRLMVNYDDPRQYLNFNRTDYIFDIHPYLMSPDLQT